MGSNRSSETSRIGHLAVRLAVAASVTLWGGCGGTDVESQTEAFTSASSTLYDFDFDGELVTEAGWPSSIAIDNQLLYTVGQLNGVGGVGRLDATRLDSISTESIGDGLVRVRYHATMPVAWPKSLGGSTPDGFVFRLPRNVSEAGLESFAKTHGGTCVDLWSAHDVGPANMWYYYRPHASGCAFEDGDVSESVVSVALSTQNSADSYPELDAIWRDGVLNAVVVFGKDRVGATGFSDFGIAQYGQFNYRMRWTSFGDLKLMSTPADLPGAPDEKIPEVTWNGTFSDGRRIEVHAFIIDNPQLVTAEFEARYATLSRTADILVYNGHAALGANVRAFARMGEPNPGQYTIVSMMGCDTFAYVDGFMAAQRSALNADDPSGTKYLDMITNIVPTNPVVLSTASLALIRGVAEPESPRSYLQILREFEPTHHAVVTGDEDNEFRPN